MSQVETRECQQEHVKKDLERANGISASEEIKAQKFLHDRHSRQL